MNDYIERFQRALDQNSVNLQVKNEKVTESIPGSPSASFCNLAPTNLLASTPPALSS